MILCSSIDAKWWLRKANILLSIVNNWVKISPELLSCCELRHCKSVNRAYINCYVVNVHNSLGSTCFQVYVPDECKDQKYWSRRKKNNVAAKRSREARRIKENQIALRAAYLEKENSTLKDELKKMKLENTELSARLEKYEGKRPLL